MVKIIRVIKTFAVRALSICKRTSKAKLLNKQDVINKPLNIGYQHDFHMI
jgi:hypothetical protein